MSKVNGEGLPSQFNRGALLDILRSYANQLNGLSEGRIAAKYNALTSAPTTGTHAQGDFVANSAPVEVSSQYVLLGWICTASGTPGTFEEVRTLTTAVSGSGDMLAANNLSDVADVPTARTNLGLGTAAVAAATDFQASDTQLTALAGLSYAGNALKYIRVNAGEAGFELSAVSGGASVTEVEIDFGSTPVYDATFTITDAAITSSAVKVVVSPCGKAATGRTADDWQWDGGTFAANPGTGSATCYATFHPGPIVGKRMLQYSIG